MNNAFLNFLCFCFWKCELFSEQLCLWQCNDELTNVAKPSKIPHTANFTIQTSSETVLLCQKFLSQPLGFNCHEIDRNLYLMLKMKTKFPRFYCFVLVFAGSNTPKDGFCWTSSVHYSLCWKRNE